ncbi:phage tail sheath N-terminal beta-sandwich domain-containing protein [Exiguobacterium sp. UBA5002]|uniref:phage tail sheath N-terminal beta-sandwich domain-containing protein n=1 Tax=Exiguobacterium sp. UBA5002 TaxID=1946497 RepID=UPI0025C57DFA|nr:phage tail sheath N-terminal beta-sandwich domain-containing protein [Exiguobacterium sp. UBA5002]
MAKAMIPGRHERQADVYVRFNIATTSGVESSARGTLLMPIRADWGPINQIVTVRSMDEAKTAFGSGQSAFLLQDAFLNSAFIREDGTSVVSLKEIKVYRLAASAAKEASLDLTSIKVKARYKGARGNQFAVTVRPVIGDNNKKELLLTENALQLEKLTFASNDDLVALAANSKYIRVEKVTDALPANVVAQLLTAGHSGEAVTALDYGEFLEVAKPEYANAIIHDGVSDSAIQAMFLDFVRTQRPNGQFVKTALGGLASADVNYYGAISTMQKAYKEGVEYSPAQQAVLALAAAISIPVNRSLAGHLTIFDDLEKLSDVDANQKIEEGYLLLKAEGKNVVYNAPVNSMTDFSRLDPLIGIDADADPDAALRDLQQIQTINVFDLITEEQEFVFKKYFRSQSNSPSKRDAVAEKIKQLVLEPLASSNIEVIEPVYDCVPDSRYHGEGATEQAYKTEAYFKTVFTVYGTATQIYANNTAS